MSTTTINKSIFLAASRETVWEYLTDKDKLALWFHPAAANLEAGKPFRLLKDASDSESKICWGDVLSADKPSSLIYTFTIGGPMGDDVSTVNWTLEEAAGGTRVSVSHEGISEAAGEAALGLLMALDAGWDEHFVKLRKNLAA